GLELSSPTVATYNAFANNLFREYSMLIGLESESTLLTEAGAFQLVKRILKDQVEDFDLELSEQDQSYERLVELVLEINQQIVENRTTAEEVSAEINTFIKAVNSLPKKIGDSDGSQFAYIKEFTAPVGQTPLLADLAKKYQEQKVVEGYVDYADQIRYACDAVEKHPELVVAEQRKRFTHVLLDEYQDTSFLQTKLLQGLFSNHSVLAVGDPNQSIYGWRGASASNLDSFGTDFGAGFGEGTGQVRQYMLQTSWRNPSNVLEIANDLARPLALAPSYLAGVSNSEKLRVATLQSKPNAIEGRIQLDYYETVHEEAEAVASWLKAKFDESKQVPSAAVLMRSRTHMSLFRDAIESKGIPADAFGLGGLLETPEVLDLISALRVIHTPNSGSALIRLLAGPRWRIGAKDIAALNQYARGLDRLISPLSNEDQVYSPEDATSIVDAIDYLADETKTPRGQISDAGFERMRDAAQLLRGLRRQVGLPLLEFTHLVMQELWLDIEVQANPKKMNPMANLNAFFEKVASFATNNSAATLGNFVEWLDYLAVKERIEVADVTKRHGVVQLLTIHAAKGLEWNYVAIPELRSGTQEKTGGWITPGKWPHQLRGDAASLPQLSLKGVGTQKEFADARKAFQEEMKVHLERESRRVMYVAITRPETELFVSGSYWKPGVKNAAAPNQYFMNIANSMHRLGLISTEKANRFEAGSTFEEQPIDSSAWVASWPLQPFGEEHAVVFKQRAKEVEKAKAEAPIQHRLQKTIELLLVEEQQRIENVSAVELPVRIPASNFHKYIFDFDETVMTALRPLPEEPYQQSLTGTEFHGWLEGRFGRGAIIDIDTIGEEEAEENPAVDIRQLQKTFAESRWAGLTPVDVEVEIQVSIGSNTFICKLDAVYKTESGFEIVDWKTGSPPKDKAQEEAKALQLALYRMAYSKYKNVDPELISSCLFFVTDNLVISPQVKTEAEIISLWATVLNQIEAEKN
ncbi:MAG: ATP-dependent DNA helicase, partial [Actinomycetes bacterium]